MENVHLYLCVGKQQSQAGAQPFILLINGVDEHCHRPHFFFHLLW